MNADLGVPVVQLDRPPLAHAREQLPSRVRQPDVDVLPQRREERGQLDTLRAEIAALLASLWVDVDVNVPYAAGELLARIRERGTVELEYGERDVRVRGRAAPGLAGELRAVAATWAESLASTNGTEPAAAE